MGTIQSDVNEARRDISRQILSISRIKAQVAAEEQGAIKQFKKSRAKQKAMRVLALRRHQTKLDAMIDKLQDVSLKLATLPAEEATLMAMETLRDVTRHLNMGFDRVDVATVLADTERMELKSQVIGDVMSVQETGDEEEADAMVAQLCDELSLDMPPIPARRDRQLVLEE